MAIETFEPLDIRTEVTHRGTWGNLSGAFRNVVGSAAVADVNSVFRFFIVPSNTLVLFARTTFAAFGGTTGVLDYGFLPVDGSAGDDDAILSAVNVDSAGDAVMTLVPFVVPVESYLAATVKTAALATANAAAGVTLTVSYVFKGMK